MKIETDCPGCGSHVELEVNSLKMGSLICGCGHQKLAIRPALTPTFKWFDVKRPVRRGGTGSTNRILQQKKKETLDKLRKAYGGGTVTGRATGYTPTEPKRVYDATMGRYKVQDPVTGQWRWQTKGESPIGYYKPDTPLPTPDYHFDASQMDVPDGTPITGEKFNGHATPDNRTRLVRKFQDTFGKD